MEGGDGELSLASTGVFSANEMLCNESSSRRDVVMAVSGTRCYAHIRRQSSASPFSRLREKMSAKPTDEGSLSGARRLSGAQRRFPDSASPISRVRASYSAYSAPANRTVALSLVRADKTKGSVKTRRKAASWDTSFLLEILQTK